MKKRALSLVLALVLCLSLSIPAFARVEGLWIYIDSDSDHQTCITLDHKVDGTDVQGYVENNVEPMTKYTIGEGDMIGVNSPFYADGTLYLYGMELNEAGIYQRNGKEKVLRYGDHTLGSDFVGCWTPRSKVILEVLPAGVPDSGSPETPAQPQQGTGGAENGGTVSLHGVVKITQVLSTATAEESIAGEDLTYALTCNAPAEVISIGDLIIFSASAAENFPGGDTLQAQNWEEYKDSDYGTPLVRSGAKYTLSEPGLYYVAAATQPSPTDLLFRCGFKITVLPAQSADSGKDQPAQPSSTPVSASPTNDKLTVNGTAAAPTVYKIAGSNYFKLRDVAALLSGTEKQFSVGYDNAKKSATATTGQSYTKQAGDLAGAATGGSQTAAVSNDTIYVDGEKVDAQVYKIGGSNYFKLRDLGKALNFYVGWSREQGMFIDTSKPYSE